MLNSSTLLYRECNNAPLKKKVYKCTTLKVQQQTMYYQFFNLIEYETQKFYF